MTHVLSVWRSKGRWFWSCHTCSWFDGGFRTRLGARRAAQQHAKTKGRSDA